MSEPNQTLPIDPKEAAPAGAGFVIGLLILGFFYVVAKIMSLPTFVYTATIPYQ